MPAVEHLLIGVALFLCLSVVASKLAARSGIPALLLFLAIGMLAGSDGPGGIYFDNPWLAQAVGVVALVLILYSGGLDTRLADIQPVLRQGIALATVGVCVTALAVGVFAVAVLGFTLIEGVLLGAIISATDAAAVLTLLRGKGIRLKSNLSPLLELESGSNDPMAVFLTIGMIQLAMQPQTSPLALIPMFIQQMALGAAAGIGMGYLTVQVVNRLRLEYEGLYPVVTLGLVALTFGATTALHGSGFLAVYLAGLVAGNRDFIHKRSLLRFHDGIAWLMQIVMFLTLGLQVFPTRFIPIAGVGLLVAAFLIFIARPVSVFLALTPFRMGWREKAFVSWVGLRGATPIVLATFPLLAGLSKADTIFNLVFFIVLTSVLLQGTLIAAAARWLGLEDDRPPAPRSPLASVMEDGSLSTGLIELTIPPESAAVGRQLLDLGLPPETLIVVIARNGDMLVPGGSTVLAAGDTVLLLAPKDRQQVVQTLLRDGSP